MVAEDVRSSNGAFDMAWDCTGLEPGVSSSCV